MDRTAIGPARDGMELLVGGLSGLAFSRHGPLARRRLRAQRRALRERSASSARRGPRPPGADLGREASQRLWGQGYLLSATPARGEAYLRDYYAFTGAFAERIAAGKPHERPRRSGLRPRLRGGGLRRSWCSSPRRRARGARTAPREAVG